MFDLMPILERLKKVELKSDIEFKSMQTQRNEVIHEK